MKIKFEIISPRFKVGKEIIAFCVFDKDKYCCISHYIFDFDEKLIKEYKKVITEEINNHIKIYIKSNKKLNK